MVIHRFALALALFALPPAAALAQQAPAADPPPPASEPGQYQLFQGTMEGKTTTDVFMLDTEFGRSWILRQQPDGTIAWERIPLIRIGDLPDNKLPRPTTVRR